jgi:hypothetical protein
VKIINKRPKKMGIGSTDVPFCVLTPKPPMGRFRSIHPMTWSHRMNGREFEVGIRRICHSGKFTRIYPESMASPNLSKGEAVFRTHP